MREYEAETSFKNMSERKKLILKISAWVIVLLIICTFVSNSIYTMLLPKVETVKSEVGALLTELNYNGKICYSGEDKITAVGETKILDVFVKQGDIVKKGDKLMLIDTAKYSLQEKRLKLALLQLENQLKPNEVLPAQKAEAQMQLDIAAKEYELFKLNSEIEKALSGDRWNAEQMKFIEQSEVAQAELTAAYAQWQKYWFAGVAVDRTEELKLRNKIANYERMLKSHSLTEEKRNELELDLQMAKVDLDALVATFPEDYDYVLERQYRANVLKAQNNVLLLDEALSEDEKNSAQLAYELAQEEYKRHSQTDDIQQEITEQKLKLDVLRYENMLKPQSLSAPQKQAINLSVDIAKQELAEFQTTMPGDGIITAAADGVILNVSANANSKANDGDTLVSFAPDKALPYVEWSSSNEAGGSISEGQNVSISFNITPTEENGFSSTRIEKDAKVNTKRYDEESDKWYFTALLEKHDDEIYLGKTADISLQIASKVYQSVVPLACISTDNTGGYSVMQVATRNGMFSQETYIQEIPVEIIDKNNFYAAIDSQTAMYGADLVKYTSKPVRNGTVVALQ